MPLAYCPIDCDDDAHADRRQSTPPMASAAAGETAPQPTLRGSWRGRAPDYLLADLRASAASGAGLAFMPTAPRSNGSLALPIIGLALLALALRSRSS